MYGKKKEPVILKQPAQEDLFQLASEALRKTRGTRLRLPVEIAFTSPILMQRWTTKAVRKMLGKMVGMEVVQSFKDLTEDYEDSWYRNDQGAPALPCRIFKASFVEGAISTSKLVTKADIRRSLRVLGHTAPLLLPKNEDKEMDTKIVHNSNGSPDVRARALFPEGTKCRLVIEFGLPLTVDKVMAAIEAAGATIGVCEWRPDKGGDFGTFEVNPLPSDEKSVQKILHECRHPEDEFVLAPEMLRAITSIPDEKLSDGARKVKALAKHQAEQRTSANGASANG